MAPFLSQSTCSYTLQDLFSPNVFSCFHYLHTCLRDIIFQCLFSLVSSFLDILGMFFPISSNVSSNVSSHVLYIKFHTCFFFPNVYVFHQMSNHFPMCFPMVHPNSLRVLIFVPAIFRFFSHFHDISSLFQPFSHGFPQVFGPFLPCLPRETRPVASRTAPPQHRRRRRYRRPWRRRREPRRGERRSVEFHIFLAMAISEL